jgi:hypothetical protein
VLLALSLLFGASCGFNVGRDYPVTVTWLINGVAPSQALCDAQGIDRIRFTVLGPGKARSLFAGCAEQVLLDDGYYYGGFVSTYSFDYETRYNYRVEMIDKNGAVVQNAMYADGFQVQYGDDLPWVLTPLELFSPEGDVAGVSGTWTIAGRKANPADCQTLGATSVAIDFASSTDNPFDDAFEIVRADCQTGHVISDGAVLSEGEYNVRYVALDQNDKVIQDVVADQLYVVDKPGTLDVETIDFHL